MTTPALVDRLPDIFQLTVLENILREKAQQNGLFADFSRQRLEMAREDFQRLDRDLIKENRKWVAHQTSQRQVPLGNARGKVKEYSEFGLVQNEIGKQKRHVKIRDLMHRAGNAVQALKPCFMMSPLSVSQFLDAGFSFDLVIMDEASQIKPEDALGSLMRAKQLVIVGDPKQLPPTSFFDRQLEETDNDEETLFDNNESVLEVAAKTFQPQRRLRWHYRSRHEDLIAFSNKHFYEEDLIVFPSAGRASGSLGLRLHQVPNGTFKGGINQVEAEMVADAIIRHAQETPEISLGVGAFNKAQAELIQDLLDKRCTDSLTAFAVKKITEREEPLFIKNLENLQGDERDVIYISFTYGKDPASGRVFNRFGPMTSESGWRRLNVLITRARCRLEVFTSLEPADIQSGPEKSRGVRAMRDFLEYCKTGQLVEAGVIGDGDFESHFEETVGKFVRQLGYVVQPQVGVAGYFIDLGVAHPSSPGDFLLGIECDGRAFHSSKSARDRDRLREEVIKSRGWNLHRVWSTDWYVNRSHEERRLQDAILSVLNATS